MDHVKRLRRWTHEEIAEAFEYVRCNLPENVWREYAYQENRWNHIRGYVCNCMLQLLKDLHPQLLREDAWELFLHLRGYFVGTVCNQRPLAPFTPADRAAHGA